MPDPLAGLKVAIKPSQEGVHLLVKEIQHRARVYSMFDVAQLFLGSRERCVLELELDGGKPALFCGRRDASAFVTKDEAVAHFMASPLFAMAYETQEVECDPPSGNFQVVARCGMSGEWLGPPNFHSYQANLRRLHREKFANLPFDRFVSKVRTERGEEAVNAWLDTMRKQVRWRAVGGDDESWMTDRGMVERDFVQNRFGEYFEECRVLNLPGNIDPAALSESVMASIRIAGGHVRRHPAMLIPPLCRMLEAEHLAIFKRQGKLFCGPARPHPLDGFDELSDRPAAIVRWLDANPEAKLEGLWPAVLPEGEAEPSKEWLLDLFWLLSQGHVLLFEDGSLVLPKKKAGAVTAPAAEPRSKKKKKKRKPKTVRVRAAKHPSPAKTIRLITRMTPGEVKKLRGPERIWGRRLLRRNRITSLAEDA
ncbi:MAG: hypothetical protein MUF31_02490 [Akkermansiaceae bacterium]|jgi:hypothetical protein|nr:hypothetical protein [Akkermansiaceae bacterium]